jgi:hypothetical protein
MGPGALWPPRAGEPLPRAAEATGVHDKLGTYSLDPANERGRPKARGFELILGITAKDIDYLEGAIQTGVLVLPVSSVRDNQPWGIKCVVMVPVRGRHQKRGRVVNVRTAWAFDHPTSAPRLASAYVKP